MNRKLVVICGITGSGKSRLALDIAEKSNGVIVNADSQQIYKNIPIISASPTREEKKKSNIFCIINWM